MTGHPCFRCQGILYVAIAALMLHGALSVSVGQDPSSIAEEKHRIEVAAAGSTLHDTARAAGDEAALQTPMVPRRRLVRAVEDMGPPGVTRPSLVETVTAPPGTNIPENYTSANFAFDPYKDGPANVIGQPGPPGHEGLTGHQGTIGNTGSTGHQGAPGSEGRDGPMGKPGHMFHLHGYATRSEVLKVFMLNFTMTTVAFLFLLKKLKEKYGPKGHGVEFSLTIDGIDVQKLQGETLWQSIQEALKESVSSQVGVSSSETHITLSGPGPLTAEFWIDKPDKEHASQLAETIASSNANIMKTVSERLTKVPGIGDIQKDGSTLSCTSVSAATPH